MIKGKCFKNINLMNGISLITLVITIIVIIILAGAVILTLAQNNPVEAANEATFKSNASGYRDELLLYINSQYASRTGNFDPSTINATATSDPSIKDIIKSMKETDKTKYEIQDGELVFVGEDTTEASWADQIGITATNATVVTEYAIANQAVTEGNLGTPINENSTINGNNPSYNNPVIPANFFAVNTTAASWNNVATDYNNGLVIEDLHGNQFVWVPVDGESVTYSKLGSTNPMYVDVIPEGFNETNITTKYKGFYVARFESSFDYNSGNIRSASKKSSGVLGTDWSTTRDLAHNGYLWNYISYNDAKSYAEAMDSSYGYSTVQTHLVIGTQRDVIMKWLENSGINVSTDSTTWGNYANSTFNYEWPESGIKQMDTSTLLNTGAAERNKSKNIYDLARKCVGVGIRITFC